MSQRQADNARKWYLANRDLCLERNRLWAEANRERKRELDRSCQTKNRAAIRERKRELRKLNPEKEAKYNAEYYAANRQKSAAAARRRYAADPEKFAQTGRTRRARRNGSGGVITKKEVLALLEKQRGKCVSCRNALKEYHLDHVMPLSLGGQHVIENAQILCPTCNLKKGSKHPDEWARQLGRLFA